jgi:hypothetical protein
MVAVPQITKEEPHMSGSNWKQKVIDGYLQDSGRNQFVPAEFLGWLKNKPDHECYEVFFGMTDEAAAQAYREELVRKWVSGLRIVVRAEADQTRTIGTVEVREYSVPLYHSPVAGRREGGGYIPTDPSDPSHLAELARQGAVALAAWIERYEGTAIALGADLSGVKSARISLDAAAEMADPSEDAA